jgi:hypothetical protein
MIWFFIGIGVGVLGTLAVFVAWQIWFEMNNCA